MKFSQRIGKTPIKTELQIETMDQELRVALWNVFDLFFLKKFREESRSFSSEAIYKKMKFFLELLWINYFDLPTDTIHPRLDPQFEEIRGWFFDWEWYEVYDFIEFVAQTKGVINDVSEFRGYCNIALERKLSAYRFVDTQIAPITDENELREIEKAIVNTVTTKLSPVQTHLKSALSKLSDRRNPDYRNSIKESISAVEAISKIIANEPKATLTQAIKPLENKIGLHPNWTLDKSESC